MDERTVTEESIDRETDAMNKIAKALLPLSPKMREAVLRFADAWCEERQAKAVQRGGLPSEATIEGEVSDGD